MVFKQVKNRLKVTPGLLKHRNYEKHQSNLDRTRKGCCCWHSYRNAFDTVYVLEYGGNFMKRFKPGQQVVCIHPTGMWLGVLPGPFYGDIVTVDRYSVIHQNAIELVEYPVSRVGNEIPDCFVQTWFEPVADLDDLKIENKLSEGVFVMSDRMT